MAKEDYAKKFTFGLELTAVSYGVESYEDTETKTTDFDLGNVHGGFSFGYTFTRLIEVGTTVGFGYYKFNEGDSTDTVKNFSLTPYLNFNIWASDKIVVPLGIYIGYEADFYGKSTVHYGLFAFKSGVEFFVADVFSIGPSIMFGYSVGKVDYSGVGSEYDRELSKWRISFGADFTVWL